MKVVGGIFFVSTLLALGALSMDLGRVRAGSVLGALDFGLLCTIAVVVIFRPAGR